MGARCSQSEGGGADLASLPGRGRGLSEGLLEARRVEAARPGKKSEDGAAGLSGLGLWGPEVGRTEPEWGMGLGAGPEGAFLGVREGPPLESGAGGLRLLRARREEIRRELGSARGQS